MKHHNDARCVAVATHPLDQAVHTLAQAQQAHASVPAWNEACWRRSPQEQVPAWTLQPCLAPLPECAKAFETLVWRRATEALVILVWQDWCALAGGPASAALAVPRVRAQYQYHGPDHGADVNYQPVARPGEHLDPAAFRAFVDQVAPRWHAGAMRNACRLLGRGPDDRRCWDLDMSSEHALRDSVFDPEHLAWYRSLVLEKSWTKPERNASRVRL